MKRVVTLPEISEQEKAQLITYVRSHAIESRLRLRAQMILDWIDGLTYKASSQKNNVSQLAIAKWRKRFAQHQMQGLGDAPRLGKPPRLGEEERNKVIHQACQRTESGTQLYSQHEIADKCGVSQSWVSEILRRADLKPHKTDYWCGKSPDPHFDQKNDRYCGPVSGSA